MKTRKISKNKSLIIESVQNVNPPDIMGHQIKAYSLKLAFSKEYMEKIEKLYPGLEIGKPTSHFYSYLKLGIRETMRRAAYQKK